MESNTRQLLLNSCENKKPSNSKDVEGGVSGVLSSLKFSIRFVLVAAILWMLLVIFLVLFFKDWSCQSSYISVKGICNKKRKEPSFRYIIPSFRRGDPIKYGNIFLFRNRPDEVVIPKGRTPDKIVKNISYIMDDDDPVSDVLHPPSPLFGGHFSWKQREESFKLNSSMKVQCGFMRNGGGEIDQVDIEYVKKCKFVVVSAIFGQSVPEQPSNISHRSKKLFCFLMVVDEVSLTFMDKNNFVRHDNDGGRWVGIWRLVLLKHPPYDEPRRNENVAKMLTHRLFTQAQYSIWIDGERRMTADPLVILQRYLWRGKNTFAIPENECIKSIYKEAKYAKRHKQYAQPLIDLQMKIYYYEGLEPWSSKKTTVSDVPEGGLIIREHTTMSNLFSCLWFNEVNFFTPIEQLSFGYVLYRLGDAFKLFMFPNWQCQFLSKFYQPRKVHYLAVECVTDPSDSRGNCSGIVESTGGLGLWSPYPGDLDSIVLPEDDVSSVKRKIRCLHI